MTAPSARQHDEEPGSDATPHVFVADLVEPQLDPADAHHLTRALRLRQGAALTVSDGTGAWRRCVLNAASPEPVGPIIETLRPRPEITVAFALVKGQKPELVVQKLTELGVDRIVPFVAERSVVRWDADRARSNGVRLARVAREAAMQSRRCWLPAVSELRTFDQVVGLPDAVRADRGGDPLTLATPTVLIGPEGGWSAAEQAEPLGTVALGPHVLRAETAAIAAGVVLGGLRSGFWVPGNRTQRAATGISDYGS